MEDLLERKMEGISENQTINNDKIKQEQQCDQQHTSSVRSVPTTPSQFSFLHEPKYHEHHPIFGSEEFFDSCVYFTDIPVSDRLISAYYSNFGRAPRPRLIQNKVMKPLFEGKDCTIITPKGSGMTTAYVSAVIDRLEKNRNTPSIHQLQGLILVSMDQEAKRVLRALHCYDEESNPPHHFHALDGNTTTLPPPPPSSSSSRSSPPGIDVLVGTPSAVCQWMMSHEDDEKDHLFSALKIFVLRDIPLRCDSHPEESPADQKVLLFDQLSMIFQLLPNTSQQILIFHQIPRVTNEEDQAEEDNNSTNHRGWSSLLSRFVDNKLCVFYFYDWKEMLQLEQFRQRFIAMSKEEDKLPNLQDLLEVSFPTDLKKEFHVIIYCQSSMTVDYIRTHLLLNQLNPESQKMIENVSLFCIDEHTNHEEKQQALTLFRNTPRSILVSSISFQYEEIDRFHLSLIIHYEICQDKNQYVLRSGGFPGRMKAFDTLVVTLFHSEADMNQMREFEMILTEQWQIISEQWRFFPFYYPSYTITDLTEDEITFDWD